MRIISLFSLLPLSYIVVPNRELVNILFSFILSSQSSLQELTNIRKQQMNIKVDILRGQSILSSPDSC